MAFPALNPDTATFQPARQPLSLGRVCYCEGSAANIHTSSWSHISLLWEASYPTAKCHLQERNWGVRLSSIILQLFSSLKDSMKRKEQKLFPVSCHHLALFCNKRSTRGAVDALAQPPLPTNPPEGIYNLPEAGASSSKRNRIWVTPSTVRKTQEQTGRKGNQYVWLLY